MISTSERLAEHLFAGRNTQQVGDTKLFVHSRGASQFISVWRVLYTSIYVTDVLAFRLRIFIHIGVIVYPLSTI